LVYPRVGDNHHNNTLAKNNDDKLKQLVTTLPDDNDNDNDNDTMNDVSSRTKRSHAKSPNDPTSSSSSNKNNKKKKKMDGPEVVWLMSFPNSGTSYTMMNTERMTNQTTASNYAKDFAALKPVREDLTQGPFLHKLYKQTPENYILTKTHCGGFCNDCGPKKYILSQAQFQQDCCTGSALGVKNALQYDSSVPSKAIHLFRNPFDNLVARFHLHLKRHAIDEKMDVTLTDLEGYHRWCKRVDAKYAEQDRIVFHGPLRKLMDSLPCHADLYRYVQWHNHAIATSKKLDLPVHYVYYEDYSKTATYNATVHSILDFLEAPAVLSPLEFTVGHNYATYYSDRHAKMAARLAKALATPECWKHIQHYFAPWL
jgi:hypothetical protein